MDLDPRHELGRRAERHAARLLQRRGYRILARNWRCRLGEIDLVAQEGGDLVIVEVKARVSDEFGGPEGAVGPAKQRKLSRLLDCYLLGREPLNCRFDVVAMRLDERGRLRDAEVYQHAFRYLA